MVITDLEGKEITVNHRSVMAIYDVQDGASVVLKYGWTIKTSERYEDVLRKLKADVPAVEHDIADYAGLPKQD